MANRRQGKSLREIGDQADRLLARVVRESKDPTQLEKRIKRITEIRDRYQGNIKKTRLSQQREKAQGDAREKYFDAQERDRKNGNYGVNQPAMKKLIKAENDYHSSKYSRRTYMGLSAG